MATDNTGETCSVCGATLRKDRITYTQVIGNRVYVLQDVPADVCPQCGEEYLSPATVTEIQKAITSGQPQRTVQVPVYDLSSL